jgi:uncharacterized membrane protein
MASPQPASSDWASALTRRLDHVVGLIRDHSVRPATKIARYAVVGVLGAVVGVAVLVFVVIGVIRLFDTSVFRGHVFATDFLFGGILLGAGTFLLRASTRAGRAS